MGKKKDNIVTEHIQGEDYDYAGLAESMGAEILGEMDSVRYWIDTGSLALNYVCSGKFFGGGIPSGKMLEIFGNSSSCKTLFGMNILYGVQKAGGLAIFLDAENTLSKEFAEKASHLDSHRVIVLKADSLEKAFAKIHTAIRRIQERYGNTKPTVIVYDSIAVSPSEREFAETTLDEDATAAQKKAAGVGADKPGERARICGKELRKLNPVLSATNTTVVFINQLREKIGVMFGDPRTVAGGGKGLEYYTSMRLETKAKTRLKDARDNVIGMCVSVNNVKNKCFRPFIQTRDMQLFFDQGINPLGGLLELLIKAGRITKEGAMYKVLDPWAGGKEVKFKASLERNDIPASALLEAPKLVDAESAEQISDYLKHFGSGQNTVEISSEDIMDETDG